MTDARTREGAVQEALQDLEVRPTEGGFSSMGMLLVDSVLSGDEASMITMGDGLRRMIGRAERDELPGFTQEDIGRARALLIGVLTGKNRMAPADAPRRHRLIHNLPSL